MRRRRLAAVAVAMVSAAVAAASVSASEGQLRGTITADGSSTVGPYVTAAAEAFQRKSRNVRITVGILGTGGGFERFCKGETDISNASRKIRQGAGSEAERCRNAGIRYIAFAVANDGLRSWSTGRTDGRAA